MQRLEVSGAVRLMYKSLGVKRLSSIFICACSLAVVKAIVNFRIENKSFAGFKQQLKYQRRQSHELWGNCSSYSL